MHFGAWKFIESPEAETEEKLTWREREDLRLRKDRAYTIIYQSLSKEYRPLISSTTDGAVAWKILSDHFEPTTRARIIQLLDDFFGTKYVPGENLGLFLCRVKQAAQRLSDVGHKLQNLYQGYQMIRRLPVDFRPTVQAIYRWKDEDFTPDKIETELLLEENRLKLTQPEVELGNAVAFCTKSEKKPGNIKPCFKNPTAKFKNSKIGPCHFCKSYGHLIANCKKRLNSVNETKFCNSKTKGYNSKKFHENSNVEVKNSEDNSVKSDLSKSNLSKSNISRNDNSNVINVCFDNVMNCAFSEREGNLIELSPETCEANLSDLGNSSWVFDTGATAHFCNNKNLYLDFEPVKDMQMSLAVGEGQCPVEGKGTVQFLVKCKNGKFNQITLKDVLYNPKLRRNLLSGSRLAKFGISFTGSKGKVNVYDKDKNFLFYALRKNDLYFLKPSKYVTNCKGNDNSVNVSANQVEKVNEL